MRDYIDIGSAPAEEDCAAVGSENYTQRAKSECNRFIEEIRKALGPEPAGARLRVKSNPHDFGTYYSVVCEYDDRNPVAINYAYDCEGMAPTRWTIPSKERDSQDRVCDSCLSCAYDQGVPDRETAMLLMMEMGSDVEDHICDRVEDPNLPFECRCGCRSR